MNLIYSNNMSAKGGSARGGKKVLLVTRPICPPWDEASKNFAYYLVRNIPDLEFYILTNKFLPDLPGNIHQKPIYTSGRLTWLQRPRLLKLMKVRKDFDIIHFMLTPNKLNAFGFKTFIKSKKVKTIQTIATLREDLFSDNDYKAILFADVIITYSDYAKNKLNRLGFANVKRVYPGIDTELYFPAMKHLALLNQLKLEQNDFIITYPGEFTRLGAIDDIINMALQYSGILTEKKIKIILACRVKNKQDFEKREKIRDLLKKKNLTGQVILPDTFETMEKVYNSSDVVIFPVRDMKGKFDVPLAVIEAMACAKPVIISDLPILAEFASSNNACIIKPGDPELLWTEIIKLYESQSLRDQIGAQARKFVEENFDIRKIAEIYSKIYEIL
jgi:glycosyltransferase involved in cell wall biosynthesis